jgi:hypothetical protein
MAKDSKGGKMAHGGSINNYDWKSKPLTLRTSDWQKKINYPRYHNFNGKTYNLIYNFNSKAEALRKIKDIGMTDTILQPIKYSDGKGGGLPKYFVYVSSDSADQYAKGGKMAHGGKVLSPKQRMFKNVLEDLEKQGHLDMPNPTRDIHHIASTSVTTSTGVKNQLKELRRLKHLDLSDNNINIIASKFGKRKMAHGGDIPKGYHKMPDGTIMADSEHNGKSGKMAHGGGIGKAKKGNKFKDEQDVMGWSDEETEKYHKAYKKHYGRQSIDDIISYVKGLDSKNEENEKINVESDIVYYYPQKDLDKYEKEIGFTKSPLFKEGGLTDAEGRYYYKSSGRFLSSAYFDGDLDFLNY